MEIAPNLKRDKEYIFNLLGYSPSKEQWDAHLSPHREVLVAGGERGGKSKWLANDIFGSIFFLGAKLVWLFGSDYQETSQEYGYCIENASRLGILQSASKNYNPGEIKLTIDCDIKTVSGTDVTKIGREAPDYIGACEAAKNDYITYLRLKARTAEKRAPLRLSGTFESSIGWYVERFNEGQSPNDSLKSISLPSWTNLVIFPGGREDPEIKRMEAELPEDLFMERFGGIPCPPTGLVFKEFRNTHHVREVELFEGPVYLWIDPGYAGAYAVEAVQISGDVVYVIDEIYERHKTTEEIIQIAQHKPWWPQVRGGAIDIAARQHQAMGSVEEQWLKQVGLVLISNRVEIEEGIERYRTFLKINPITNEPNIFINPNCKGLISEHGGCPNPFTGHPGVYRYKLDKDSNVISEKPEDKNNHAIKAIIYGLVDKFGYASVSLEKLKPKVKVY